MPASRRLAAILADIAGYSRLMGADEAGTARALREHRAAARLVAVAAAGHSNPLLLHHLKGHDR
jgi:class 3 adenylate cyclase